MSAAGSARYLASALGHGRWLGTTWNGSRNALPSTVRDRVTDRDDSCTTESRSFAKPDSPAAGSPALALIE